LKQGHPEQALPELKRAIEIRPHFASGEEALATAYEALGNSTEALLHWRKAHTIDPSDASAIQGLAWLLATSPDASVRNGAEAVSWARSASDLVPAEDAGALDTLAAAYAESGQFPQAVESATRALTLATAKGDPALANAIRERLRLYKQNKPYHSGRPPGVPFVAALSR
jgi:tetratricopeptide (TPR) repeat protein